MGEIPLGLHICLQTQGGSWE